MSKIRFRDFVTFLVLNWLLRQRMGALYSLVNYISREAQPRQNMY